MKKKKNKNKIKIKKTKTGKGKSKKKKSAKSATKGVGETLEDRVSFKEVPVSVTAGKCHGKP